MTILNLISDYLATVEECLIFFDHKFGRRDLIRAQREGLIPRRGTLSDDIKYQIHGVGCGVEFVDHDINFDFSGLQEVGFDAWRLWQYAEQFPERYPEFRELTAVEEALFECLNNGTISRIDSQYLGERNNRLFHFSAKLKSNN